MELRRLRDEIQKRVSPMMDRIEVTGFGIRLELGGVFLETPSLNEIVLVAENIGVSDAGGYRWVFKVFRKTYYRDKETGRFNLNRIAEQFEATVNRRRERLEDVRRVAEATKAEEEGLARLLSQHFGAVETLPARIAVPGGHIYVELGKLTLTLGNDRDRVAEAARLLREFLEGDE